jgi:hypothetical protein
MSLLWRTRLAVALALAWLVSLLMTGAVVVPMLFAYLESAQMAGRLAARMFTAQHWISLALGVALLWLLRPPRVAEAASDDADAPPPSGAPPRAFRPTNRLYAAITLIATGLLCALLIEHAAAPRIQARADLALWHRIASALFVVQGLCAAVVSGLLLARLRR